MEIYIVRLYRLLMYNGILALIVALSLINAYGQNTERTSIDSSYLVSNRSIVKYFKYYTYYKSIFGKNIYQDTLEGLYKKSRNDSIYGVDFYLCSDSIDYFYSNNYLTSWNTRNKIKNVVNSNFSSVWHFNWHLYYALLDKNYFKEKISDADLIRKTDSSIVMIFKDTSMTIDSFRIGVGLKENGIPAFQNIKFYMQNYAQIQKYRLLAYKDSALSSDFVELKDKYEGYELLHEDKEGKKNDTISIKDVNDTLQIDHDKMLNHSIQTLSGKTKTIKEILDTSNSDGIILKFWYLSCAPCLLADKHINKLEEKYKQKIISVNIYDSEEKVVEYLSRNDYLKNSGHYFFDNENIYEDMGIISFPTFIYIDSDSLEIKEGWSKRWLKWIREK